MGVALTCSNCHGKGHVQTKEGWKRCHCLNERLTRQRVGTLYSEKAPASSALEGLRDRDTLIEGPLETIRRHATAALRRQHAEGKTHLTIDAYHLIDVFLEKTDDWRSTAEASDPDLLIIMLGFGDPRNKYLPELIEQALARRELLRKPTWVVLGTSRDMIPTRYNASLADRLNKFHRAACR